MSTSFTNHVVIQGDGKRALLIVSSEGPVPLDGNAGIAFNTLLSSKEKGPRIVVHITGTARECYQPGEFDFTPTGSEDGDWMVLAAAYAGDWLDQLPTTEDLEKVASPVVLKLTSYTLESFRTRPRAGDERVLSYVSSKMYWSWRLEALHTVLDGADAVRLRAPLLSIENTLQLEVGTSWNKVGVSGSGSLWQPTPDFLRAQRAARMLTSSAHGSGGLDRVLDAPRYDPVRTHLSKAKTFLVQDPPDAANAGKEAICAVEALARLICDDPTPTLGALIKILKNKSGLDPALAKSLEGLWGYTSNAPGVRHGGSSDFDVVKAQLTLDLARSSIFHLLQLDKG